MEDQTKAVGTLHVVLRDSEGNIKEERFLENLIVTGGKAFIASRMVGVASAVMSHMAVGTSSTAAAVGQTTLTAEAAGRVALTSSTATAADATYVATFGAGVSTGALTEAGIFNAGAGGTMLNRVVFAVINKAAGDTLGITWKVTIQ